jgi:hypothetical protein
MPSPSSNPLSATVAWLQAHASFPRSRLQTHAEALLCVAALVDAEESAASQRFLVQPRDPARDAALRAHNQRRSHAHYKSDNGQKV